VVAQASPTDSNDGMANEDPTATVTGHADHMREAQKPQGVRRTGETVTVEAGLARVTTRTASLHVKAAHAAGTTLPLNPAVIVEATRRSTPAEDHLARVRTARTLALPDPQAPGKAPVLSRDLVSSNVAAAAWSAARVLTAVGPLDTETLLEAIDRSRRFRHRTPFTATELSTALTAAGATAGPDGQWCAPPDVPVPNRDRVIVERAVGRDLTRAGMIEILISAGYTHSSATGRMSSSHPLFERIGPDRYRLIGTPAEPDAPSA